MTSNSPLSPAGWFVLGLAWATKTVSPDSCVGPASDGERAAQVLLLSLGRGIVVVHPLRTPGRPEDGPVAEASAQDPVTAGLHPGEGRPGGHRQTSTPQTDRDASADTQADTLADPEAGTAGGQDGSSRAISLLTSLVSQTAVLTALVFYFGWVSTRASFRYFHVDTSLLEFSLVDYMVRGVRLAYPSFWPSAW